MSPPAAPANLKALTALRFPAAAWVTIYHYWPSLGLAARPPLVANGYLGVELFFVLSGFILSHVYLQSAGEGRFSYRSFVWARLARIYPLHVATLAGIGLMAGAAAWLGLGQLGNVVVWESLPAQLLLTQAWGMAPGGGWNHPAWSISAEWFAYLLFPAFAWLAWRLRGRPWAAAAGGVALVTGVYFAYQRLTGTRLTDAPLIWGTLRIFPCFAYGCAIYLLWRAGVGQLRLTAKLGMVAALAVIVAAAQLGLAEAVLITAFGLLILSMANLTSTGSRLFSSKAAVYLGEVSFAVYMVCIPWLLVFSHGAAKVFALPGEALPPVLWTVMLVGVLLPAMVAHHVVEKPARDTLRRLAASRSRKAPVLAEAAAAAD